MPTHGREIGLVDLPTPVNSSHVMPSNDPMNPITEAENQSQQYGSNQSLELKEPVTSTSGRGWRFYGAFGTLCLVTFIIALDSTIICVALPVSPMLRDGTP